MLAYLDFFRRQYLAYCYASLDQWSPIQCFVHQGWTGLHPICDLSFESVDKFRYRSDRLKCYLGVCLFRVSIGVMVGYGGGCRSVEVEVKEVEW